MALLQHCWMVGRPPTPCFASLSNVMKRLGAMLIPRNDLILWQALACFGMNAVWCGSVQVHCNCFTSWRCLIPAPQVHVDAANAVDRSMQDWTGCSAPFGGKVVVFMGDFQQLLPVVRGNALHTPANLHRLSTSLFATTHFDNNAHTASPHHLSCFSVTRSSLHYFARLS